jgi:hypothetical protein
MNLLTKKIFPTVLLLNIGLSNAMMDSLFECNTDATTKDSCLKGYNCGWCKNTSNVSNCQAISICYLNKSSEYRNLCEFSTSESACIIRETVMNFMIFVLYSVCISLMIDLLTNKIQTYKVNTYLLDKNKSYNTFEANIDVENMSEKERLLNTINYDEYKKMNSELSSIKLCLLLIFIQFLGLSSLLLYFSNKIYFALNTVILLIFCLIMSICFTKKHNSNYKKIENSSESNIN